MGVDKIVDAMLVECGKCPYFADRQRRVLSLATRLTSPEDFDALLAHGYFWDLTYQIPSCQDCRACAPLRIPAATFRPSRSQRRNWRRNQDIRVVINPPSHSTEAVELRYQLYYRHRRLRFPQEPVLNKKGFRMFHRSLSGMTLEFRYFLADQPIATTLVDAGARCAASRCCYYDASLERGLGTFTMLYEIEWCRHTGRDYLYLGEYPAGCQRMVYKTTFRPYETLVPGVGWLWQSFS